MSKFTGPLKVELSATRNRWATLLEPLVWEMDDLGSGDYVTVPTGFESDGVTVPRLMWWVLPPWGHPATRAAILHDYLLFINPFDRSIADRQFYLALRAVGVGPRMAFLLWASVRVFGISKGYVI